MRDDFNSQRCVAVLGSQTRAMRAQSVLSGAAIPCELIRADSAQTGQGCAYALAFSCYQEENVKRILANASIRIRSIYTETR